MQFAYPCPGCRTTNNLHDPACRFAGRPHHEIERAYTDLVAVLSGGPRPIDDLRAAIPGEWGALHAACLDAMERSYRVTEEDGVYEMPPADERRDRLRVPDRDPVRTIYEKGSVPGAHDNAVFAMIAYYEMVGFSWPETRDLVVEWLRETGTWARGGFEESSPEELVEKKRHVYETGYGFKEKAKAAKTVIDRNL